MLHEVKFLTVVNILIKAMVENEKRLCCGLSVKGDPQF